MPGMSWANNTSDLVLGVSLFNIIYPFQMGNSSPGALGCYCCHKLKRTAWCLWSSLLGQDLVTSKYSTFVIMTKAHCSSHCTKINQPSWHSWVSDSRRQWASVRRNYFLFHRLTEGHRQYHWFCFVFLVFVSWHANCAHFTSQSFQGLWEVQLPLSHQVPKPQACHCDTRNS